MTWPYQFLTLTPGEVQIRRQALDRYAAFAQLTAALPALGFLAFRLTRHLAKKGLGGSNGVYDAVPDSPSLKSRRLSVTGGWAERVRKGTWWMGDEVVIAGQFWGTRDQWIAGFAWTAWLLVLCVAGTAADYLHLTKRFGIIAASQMPFQYLLALKSLNPFALIFGSSHEQLNKWHRVLGRVVYFFLLLHAIFYLNYFIQVGILARRLFAPVVFAGVVAFVGLNLLSTTALAGVRKFSYRIFFITHLIVTLTLPPLIFFHARSARLFVVEAYLCFLADLAVRRLRTVMAKATLESIPGTNLVKVTASIPYQRINAFRSHPGSHIFLSVPASARSNADPASSDHLLFELLHNPFTVAAIDEDNGDLTLVARHLGGPMTRLLGRYALAAPSTDDGKIPLGIEGPYGAAAKHYGKLVGPSIDRILIVAGGVGATFAVPIYRAILNDNPAARVELVWAVRGAGDATWAMTRKDGKSVLDDDNVHIFLTGDILDRSAESADASDDDGEVEMSAMYRDRRQNAYTSHHNRKRPNLKKIVDDVFKHGTEERVAVLVCGPDEMGRDLRRHVGAWVMKGRDVFWHNENFGW